MAIVAVRSASSDRRGCDTSGQSPWSRACRKRSIGFLKASRSAHFTMSSEQSSEETTTSQAIEADESLKRERDELYDRLLRTTAEFDNYRKRTERERRELGEAA